MWFICCFTSNLYLLTRYLCSVLRPLGVSDLIFNNYSPKWRWIVCNYSPKWRWIGQDIHRAAFEHTGLFINTEVIITLAYTNQWISEVKNYNLSIFMPYFEICKQTRIHVSVTLFASLVKLRRKMFKNKTLSWKTPRSNFVAFFVLIGMAFSFISEI